MSFNKKRYKLVPLMVMNSGFLTPRPICLWIEAFAHSAEGILISRKTGAPMLGWKIGTQFIKELPKCFTSCSHLTNDIDPKDGWEAFGLSIDETSIYLNMTLGYGRSKKGYRVYKKTSIYPFKKYNMLCAIRYGKIVGYEIYKDI